VNLLHRRRDEETQRYRGVCAKRGGVAFRHTEIGVGGRCGVMCESKQREKTGRKQGYQGPAGQHRIEGGQKILVVYQAEGTGRALLRMEGAIAKPWNLVTHRATGTNGCEEGLFVVAE